MSRFIFVHDFYRDGYNDMLCEVQDLQAQGLWTVDVRAKAAKYELSTYHACKHKFPRMDTGYFAGRVAAIKSAATAQYPRHPVYTTPDGWDWDEQEYELLPLPQLGGNKLVEQKQGREASHIFFPSVAFLGFGIYEVTLHLSLSVFLLELVLLAHFMAMRSEILQGFRGFWIL